MGLLKRNDPRAQDVAAAWRIDHWNGVEKIELVQEGRVLISHQHKSLWLQIEEPLVLYDYDPDKRKPFILLVDDIPSPVRMPWEPERDASFGYYSRENISLMKSGALDYFNPFKFLKLLTWITIPVVVVFCFVTLGLVGPQAYDNLSQFWSGDVPVEQTVTIPPTPLPDIPTSDTIQTPIPPVPEG